MHYSQSVPGSSQSLLTKDPRKSRSYDNMSLPRGVSGLTSKNSIWDLDDKSIDNSMASSFASLLTMLHIAECKSPVSQSHRSIYSGASGCKSPASIKYAQVESMKWREKMQPYREGLYTGAIDKKMRPHGRGTWACGYEKTSGMWYKGM